MKTFKLSAICLGLIPLWQTAYAADIETVCADSKGCYYSYGITVLPDGSEIRKWSSADYREYFINHRVTEGFISNLGDETKKTIKVTVKPQHYQNIPITEQNHRDDRFILLGLGSEFDNSELIIPAGTTMTLEGAERGSDLLRLSNTKATIEKGVTLTLNPSFSPNPNASFAAVIHSYGKFTELKTSANIIVNEEEADGIHISEGKLLATDHSITLNANEADGIYLSNGTQGIVENVAIMGNQSLQTGAEIINDTTYLKLNNSNILLNSNAQSIGLGLSGGKMDVTNSTVEAALGIHTDAFGYDNLSSAQAKPTGYNNVVNITNSNIKGQETFLEVNPDTDRMENITTSTPHSTTVNAENSQLFGKIITYSDPDLDPTPLEGFRNNVTLTLKDSHWTLNGDSQIDNKLTATNSTITFEKTGDEFTTLTLGNLSGSANFILNTDLATQQSDQIIVTEKAEGEHTLSVKDSGNEPQAANGKVTLVKTSGNGEARFSLKNRDYVDAGAYRYRLVTEGGDWVLSNKAAELAEPTAPVEPTTPPKEPEQPAVTPPPSEQTNNNVAPVEPTAPVQPIMPPKDPEQPTVTPPPSEQANNVAPVEPSKPIEQVVLSEKSNALVSLRQAQLLQLEQGLAGIHQRLGELKQGESSQVWVRHLNGSNKFAATRTAANSQASGFTQDFYGLQVGADKALSTTFRLGGFVGTERAKVDFNGNYGSADIRGQSVGIYGAYQADNGFYLDNIAKFSRLKTKGAGIESRHYNAYTLSSEIGKIFTFSNQWSITPNAQLAWTTLSGNADEDRLSALYSRIGTRFAKVISLGQWTLQPYFDVNAITTSNRGSQVRVNQHHFEVASSRGRIASAFGLNVESGNHRLGLEGKTTHGKRVDQPFTLQANYRYSW